VTQSRLARPAPSEFRRFWGLDPTVVFLNHGAFGACPIHVLEYQHRLRLEMEAEPLQFLHRRYEERLDPARRTVAQFVGAKPEDLVFVGNATVGINSVVRSLRFRAGDELLTTSLDYNASRNALVEAAKATGAKVVVAEVPFPLASADEVVEAVLAKVTDRTRLALLDHVTSNTGLILPIERIVRELNGQGIDALIDGAHAPGMLALDVGAIGAAYYTGNLHKWVCAPKGSAFLWVREDRQRALNPAIISHGNNTNRPDHSKFQDRFDWPGTFDPTAWMAAAEAVRWMGGLLPNGWKAIRERNHQLAVAARRTLCEMLEVTAPCPQEMLGSLATLPLPAGFSGKPRTGKVDDEQARLFDEFGIEVPLIRMGRPEKRWFRVATQIYNSAAEFEYLGVVLREMGEEARTA
jgi:isopenicillin-N epimerase